MMFQIIDDCLDYKQDSETLGKNVVNDLKQGYVTLPMFYALKNDTTGALKDIVFNSGLSENNMEEVRSMVLNLG